MVVLYNSNPKTILIVVKKIVLNFRLIFIKSNNLQINSTVNLKQSIQTD